MIFPPVLGEYNSNKPRYQFLYVFFNSSLSSLSEFFGLVMDVVVITKTNCPIYMRQVFRDWTIRSMFVCLAAVLEHGLDSFLIYE